MPEAIQQQPDQAAPTTPAASPVPAVAPAPMATNSFAQWAYTHKDFTKKPVSYLGYQFVRSIAAAIPYGVAMAAVHHGFSGAALKGTNVGLTAKEIEKGGLKALDALGHAYTKQNMGAVIGRNVARLANSPVKDAAQIGLAFSFFRTTGGAVKAVRDKIFNDKNTPEDTQREVSHAGKTFAHTFAKQLPFELGSVPIAALVLGFMNATFAYPKDMAPIRNKAKPYWGQVADMWSPKAKLLQHAATWTISYSLFFLLAESLAKDIQLRKGTWKGHPNSLKAAPDETVGGPPVIRGSKDGTFRFEGQHENDDQPDLTKPQPKPAFPMITAEPSIGRFIFRRVLPVAVGISAYAALKRAAYLKVGGPMEAIDGTVNGVGGHLKRFGSNAWREGAATTMFFTLWAATDAWGSAFDKFFEKLQHQNKQQIAAKANDNAPVVGASNAGPALTPHQVQKYDELLARVNAKEQTSGRAA